ncbi:division/cell wall cluster transcriptional repressor MraZ [Pseudomonadota bacterium]
MALFLSTFTNKVDKKGRVSVPSQFRAMLHGQEFSGVVIYQSSINKCIEGCSIERIQKLSETIDDLDPYSKERDAFASVILGGAAQQPFDSDGRITLPQNLLDFSGIKEKAVFIGKGQTFEIWDLKAFEEHIKKAKEKVKNNRFLIKPNKEQR